MNFTKFLRTFFHRTSPVAASELLSSEKIKSFFSPYWCQIKLEISFICPYAHNFSHKFKFMGSLNIEAFDEKILLLSDKEVLKNFINVSKFPVSVIDNVNLVNNDFSEG